jgi:hypothetical protein
MADILRRHVVRRAWPQEWVRFLVVYGRLCELQQHPSEIKVDEQRDHIG